MAAKKKPYQAPQLSQHDNFIDSRPTKTVTDPFWLKLERDIEAINESARRADAEYWEAMKEVRKMGRIGMDNRDHFRTGKFVPKPVQIWSKREVKNRIKWLRAQRGELLGKEKSPERTHALIVNAKKLAKYTRELFSRESAASQQKEREAHNARRRQKRKEKRAIAKRGAQKLLADKWLTARRAARKATKQSQRT